MNYGANLSRSFRRIKVKALPLKHPKKKRHLQKGVLKKLALKCSKRLGNLEAFTVGLLKVVKGDWKWFVDYSWLLVNINLELFACHSNILPKNCVSPTITFNIWDINK